MKKRSANKKIPFWFKIYILSKNIFKKPFLSDIYNDIVIISSLIINGGIWIYLYKKVTLDPFPIILQYRVFEGAINVDTPEKVFNLPILGLFFLLFNLVLAIYFYKKEKFLSRLLLITGLVAQIIILIVAITIVLANN